MGQTPVTAVAVQLTYYYPHIMAVVFLAFLFTTDIPAKGQFFLRALVPLLMALLLAHINRLFDLWPEHLYFPSGHMTFCLGVSLSFGLLRPWTLAVTLPLLLLFGIALVAFRFHSILDVVGAIPLGLIVYGIVYKCWRPISVMPPLDSRTTSA
jgi:membrane-associated phospholipid phosphatase